MRRRWSPRASLLAAVCLSLLALPARAQAPQQYLIRGPVATVLLGLDEGAVDFELTLIASGDIAPAQGDQPPAGPRVIFSATRLSALGGTLIRRQWSGSAALPAGALSISPDLSGASLDVEVDGTLREVVGNNTPTEKAVKGRIQARWVASADPAAQISIARTDQTAAFPLQLSLAGQGRRARANITITVDGFGGPLQIEGPGTLLSPATGVLSLGSGGSGGTNPPG